MAYIGDFLLQFFFTFCRLAYVWVQCVHIGACHRKPRQPQHSLTAATGQAILSDTSRPDGIPLYGHENVVCRLHATVDPRTPAKKGNFCVMGEKFRGGGGHDSSFGGIWHKALVVGSVSLWRRLLASRL